MRSVYKFPLHEPTSSVVIPKGARILTVATQHGVPTFWALVEPQAELETRVFVAYGTGHTLPDDPGEYIGTAHDVDGSGLVFHVFEATR